MRWRPALSLGVIAALGVAVWAALSAGGDDTPSTTTTLATTTTSLATITTTTLATTTTIAATTSSTAAPDTTVDPEARLEEVRLILEDLYFRWFDAIYHNDEEAVREVIATEVYLDAFRNAVENLDLPSPPTREDIVAIELEVLRDDAQCLVTFSTIDLGQWREGVTVTGVDVLLSVGDDWRFGTAWTNRNDLWEQDCSIEPEL